MTAHEIVVCLLEDDPIFDPDAPVKDYLRDPTASFARKPYKYWKARSNLRALAKQEAGAAHVASVEIVPGNAAPEITSGSCGGWFTKGGTPIDHPGAYSRIGWSNMQYLTNDEVVTVGLDWLHKRLPKQVEIYLKWKATDDPDSPVSYADWLNRFSVYDVDDPVLPESCATCART